MITRIQTRSVIVAVLFLFMSNRAYAVAPNTVIATIPVGQTPSDVAITPDSRFVYVANNNNNNVPGGSTVSVIDVATQTVVTTISDPSFNAPYTVTINPAGTKAYVTNSGSTTISIIDIATNTVTGVINGFFGPSDMVITPDGNTGYVSNYVGAGSNTVTVVNLQNNTIIGSPIVVGNLVATLGITPDGAFVYAASYIDGLTDGTVSVIRTSDNTVIATINGFFGPYTIAITSDGKFAYVTNFGSNNFTPIGTTMSVIDLSTNTIVDTITLGVQPAGAALTPDGKLIYATNYNDQSGVPTGQGTVNVVDVATNTVTPVLIAVGQGPGSIAITPNGQYAYVANYITNNVSVIALQSFQIAAQGCKLENIFLMEKDLIDKLTWTASGASLPVSYTIYRDAQLTQVVATIPATQPLQFLDHNRMPDVVYTYYMVGVNAVGTTSDPVAITVTQTCNV